MQPEIHLGPLTLQTFGLMLGAGLRRRGLARRQAPEGARRARRLGLRDGLRRADRRPRRRAAVVDRRELGRGEGRPRRLDLLRHRARLLRRRCSAARSRCSAGRSGAATLDAMLRRRRRARRWPPRYAIGRIGCQLAGDGDYGKPWDGPWAMAYPNGTVPTTETVHPTPIYETLAMGGVAWCLWRMRDRVPPGRRCSRSTSCGAGARALPRRVPAPQRPTSWLGLTLPQLVALAMMVGGGALAAVPAQQQRARRRRAPESAARPGASCFRADHGRDQPVRLPRGRLRRRTAACSIGGCDARRARARVRHAGLRRRRGRPARPRARVPRRAGRPPRRPGEVHLRLQGVPVHRGPARVRARRAWRATSPPAASCTWRCKAGFEPARIILHGNAKSRGRAAPPRSRPASGLVVDNFDEIDKLERCCRRRPPACCSASRPGVVADTHAAILTGHAELEVRLHARARRRARSSACAARTWRPARPAHPHRLAALRPRRRAAPRSRRSRRSGDFAVYDLGGGLARRLHAPTTGRRAIEEYVADDGRDRARAARPRQASSSIEPGRALVANAGVTLYTVESVKRDCRTARAVRRRRRRHVRQPAPDALRRRYEADVADRVGAPGDAVPRSSASTASPATC